MFAWIAGVRDRLGTSIHSANPYVLDSAIAFAVAVPTSVPFVAASPGTVTALGAALNLGTVVPLIWRRRLPFTVAITVGLFALGVSVYHAPGQQLQYGLLVVMYTIADRGRPWQRRSYVTVVLATMLVQAWLLTRYLPAELMFTLLLPLTAYLLGSLARASRARTLALQDRALQLERERAADAARIVAEERARIARDMHDVLAHGVSMMVVQAEAGPVVVYTDPQRAAQTFDAIATTGREAMAQLRRVLGALGSQKTAGRPSPQPTLDLLPSLAAELAQVGLNVRLHTTGTPRRLAADVELAAYRIVQEALTNTVRHAHASTADVSLTWTSGGLALTVVDDGCADGVASDGGRGIIGIRERAAACGGSAEAGPNADGGFLVTAWLPDDGETTSLPGTSRVREHG
ncbi:sensor histidine kinase [Planctomonas sp. JC2975]|uniref:sensor histidine kinase n=1 Tax=Planctomonas sp. JC2975 TaxID=2729626 RepID=UPI001472C048|nr:sensor histidine kinase [Planctomonas sp. JC2975]NNC11282.1 sensor histidine kinase [Planctomonas sp. JC2975]